MRILFMGTPDFAEIVLRGLLRKGRNVTAVFTQPDRPQGRSASPVASPVKKAAVEAGIEVYQPEKIRETSWVEQVAALQPDVMVVAAYGQILPQSILDIAPCINVHASLLPRYRGASPIQSAIASGDRQSGVTIMRMDKGMDTGNILEQVTVPIDDTDTGESLFDRLAGISCEVLEVVLDRFEAGDPLIGRPQPAEEATYTRMLSRESGRIDWSRSARLIDCGVRAYTPWPSSFTMLDGQVLKILKVRILEGSEGRVGRPGHILDKEELTAAGEDTHQILVQTGEGLIAVERLQMSGKKPMDARSYLAGHPVYGKELGD